MANISNLLAAIKNAVYGRDVRDAIHDSISQINRDVSSCVENYNRFQNAGDSYISNRLEGVISNSELVQEAFANSITTDIERLGIMINDSIVGINGDTSKPFTALHFFLNAKNGMGHFRVQMTLNQDVFNGNDKQLGYLKNGRGEYYIDRDDIYQTVFTTSSGKKGIFTIQGVDGRIGINNWGSNPAPVVGDLIMLDMFMLLRRHVRDN